jgi:LPS-assembly protein
MSGGLIFRFASRLLGPSTGRAIGLLALALVLAQSSFSPVNAASGAASALGGLSAGSVKVKKGEQMLVEADQLVYDYDHNTVAAVGNVKIYYAGYTLEAQKVTYVKSNGRLTATGNVKMVDPSGLAVYAQDLDITSDFADGFVSSLRVNTPDKTYFAAERAERAGGETTTFVHGVYTACEPCLEHPERPALWQVRAAKIISNSKEKMVYFYNARIEFLGIPVAYVPYFSTPDPSVKRKSGFLTPTFGYTPQTGYSGGIPYFWAIAPSYDMTLTPNYFTKQGFLGEVEWRQRLADGSYTLRMAGIDQQDPHAFLTDQAGTYAQRDFRGGARTTGSFDINQWWSLGWDGTLLTDRMFTRNYDVLSKETYEITSNVHLTGLHDRSYFDARALYFQILVDLPHLPDQPFSTNNLYDQGRQAVVWPVVDYDKVFDSSILGGQLSWTSNLTYLSRQENDPFLIPGDPTIFYQGLAGDYLRASGKLDWKREMVGPLGQVFVPFASVQGDVFSLDPTSAVPPNLTDDTVAGRVTPAVGVEWSWPILATAGPTSHIFEPIAQIIARPDEMLAGKLPNNDAESLVFEDTNLFDPDKFSGFDRVEGATRLNAGVHYLGTFPDDVVVDALFGQSYNIAGKNSYAVQDIADTGNYSGLQTDDSDYVGRVAVDWGPSTRLAARARFDHNDFSVQRGEIGAETVLGAVTASAAYLYIRKDPNIQINSPTATISGNASVNILDNWRLFGSLAYDITKEALAKDSVGIAFNNSCLTFSVEYSEVRDEFTDIPNSRNVMVALALRTLGETSFKADVTNLVPASTTDTTTQ